MYSFQNTKPLNSLLNKENKGLVFYYLGDRTVIKTCSVHGLTVLQFYYLGDRTVIKTIGSFLNSTPSFYYLGDRTVIKTIQLNVVDIVVILLPGRSYGNQDTNPFVAIDWIILLPGRSYGNQDFVSVVL